MHYIEKKRYCMQNEYVSTTRRFVRRLPGDKKKKKIKNIKISLFKSYHDVNGYNIILFSAPAGPAAAKNISCG